LPAMPSGYCKTLGKDLIASNLSNLFCAIGTKIKLNAG